MITKEAKSTAIAQMKCLMPLEEIAINLDIPLKLLEEWQKNLTEYDLVQIKANTFAVGSLAKGDIELIDNQTKREEILKVKIEETAIDIVDNVGLTLITGDIVRAKCLQLCADTLTKLYSTIVNKDAAEKGDVKPNGKIISAFASIMKD